MGTGFYRRNYMVTRLMEKYDVVIIGGGATAYGALSGLGRNIRVAILTHAGVAADFVTDSESDKVCVHKFGGGLDDWHGVSSFDLFKKYFPDDIEFIKTYFCEQYSEKTDVANSLELNGLYIPNKKINVSKFVNLITERNCDVIVDDVKNLTIECGGVAISCANTFVIADKVIICAGAIGTAKLLQSSGLAKKNNDIGNHLNGYCALNQKRNPYESVRMTANGHIKFVEKGQINGKSFLIYSRPSVFDLKNPQKLSKYKTTYSRQAVDIYGKIIKSKSLGLIVEALYNRYGYWFGNSNSNRYFQIETEGLYQHVDNSIILNKKKFNELLALLRGLPQFVDIAENLSVSGIHFYNTLTRGDMVGTTYDKNEWTKPILIGDSSAMKSIGAAHHTFALMAINAFALRSIYE